MVFEVKVTHRVTSTGVAACEVHPDLFVDEMGRVFTTAQAVVDEAHIPAGIRSVDDDAVFVVEDEAIELAVDWIEVLSGDRRAAKRLEQRTQRRWAPVAGPGPLVRPDVDWASLRRDKRTVEFAVRASHRIKSLGELACELYPDVFVGKDSRGAYSRYAGMAMQQPGDFVQELSAGTQEWFRVQGLKEALSWTSTVAKIRDEFWLKRHGERRAFDWVPVGPMGPACPPRSVLTP
ncbi:hypothetical protein ACWDUD_08565 [Rhodococcus sp. NPDC003382]|uniref:hypothetical protein n=1 Tax=Rhodococcus sp. CX TaxID=2789880 RepID=UPI0018CF1F75|nr:hypothetical protein [Rhodococcus sp. CX]MBH0120426.1 hypothetical protein [Rhodococcus sp. CX]